MKYFIPDSEDKILSLLNEANTYKASDVRVGQLTKDSEIDTGVYFVTVRGEPDLVIDTIDVNEEKSKRSVLH